MSQRKIFHLLWDGDLGGVQRYVLQLVQNGFWAGTSHAVCFFTNAGRVLNKETLPDTPLYELNLRRGWDWRARQKLAAVLAQDKFDVLHCHCDTPAFALQLRHLGAYRLVYTEHGDTIMRRRRGWLTKLIWQLNGRFWDALLMNSQLVKEDFLRRFASLAPATVICPNPLLTVRRTRARALTPDGAYKIGVFGRLVWQKGIDRVLQVAQKVIAALPAAQFHIFGDGALLSKLKERRDKMGLTAAVRFNGFTDDPLVQMARMDCNLVPSRLEPFGLVALEALSVGTPVVGFYGTGVAEIVRDGEHGRLVAQGDVSAMAAATIAILSDPVKWEIISRKAKRRAHDDFQLEKHCQHLAEIYQ